MVKRIANPSTGRTGKDFTQKTKDALRDRVSSLCSHPDCQELTVSANISNSTSVTKTGEAAHIHAASPGGPRHDTSLNDAQIKDITNGIWLCTVCHTIIDSEPENYPAQLLRDWKQQAEKRSSSIIGHALVTQTEADQQASNTLANIFNPGGMKPVINIVRNAIKARKKEFEGLDSRFNIEIDYVNNTEQLTFSPNQNFSVDVNIKASNTYIKDKLDHFIKDGGKVKIPAKLLSTNDSELMNMFFNSGHEFEMSSGIRPATIKIFVDSKPPIFFDIASEMWTGQDSMTIEGKHFSDVLNIKMRYDQQDGRLDITFSVSYEKWVGQNVQYGLPEINALFDFTKAALKGNSLNIRLSNGVNTMNHGFDTSLNEAEFLKALNNDLEIFQAGIVISNYLNIEIPFKPHFEISEEEIKSLFGLHGKIVLNKQNAKDTIKIPLTINDIEAIKELKNIPNVDDSDPENLPYIHNENVRVNLFGNIVIIPELSLTFQKYTMDYSQPLDSLKVGDKVDLLLIPNSESYMEISKGSEKAYIEKDDLPLN